MKTILLIIAGSALVTGLAIKAAPAAAAGPAAETAVSIVRTADLDLSTPAGQRTLRQRLVVAAHAVCDDPSAVDLKAGNEEAHCRAEVLAAASRKAEALRNSGEVIRIAAK